METGWVVYGASGYTGAQIARRAVERGLRPTLAGRNPDRVRAVAEPLGLPWRAVALDDRAGLEVLLSEHAVVLNAAGPFARTSEPSLQACLAQSCVSRRSHTHPLHESPPEPRAPRGSRSKTDRGTPTGSRTSASM